MTDPILVRPATVADAAACAAIYEPYITDTAISFELVPPGAAEMAERIVDFAATHAWLVAEQGDRIIGYAYGHAFAPRAAYAWSVETSIYVDLGHRGGGVGRALYGDLLPILAARGYRRAFAGIALPNEPSVGLHAALGFETVAVFRRVGWKQGAWHDVAWMQLDLVPGDDGEPPGDLR